MMKKKKKGKCLRMAPFAEVIRERTERGRIVLCFVPFLFDFLIFYCSQAFCHADDCLQQVGQQKLTNATPES